MTSDLMEYTAQDSDDVVAYLQAISEWCCVSFTNIRHFRGELVIDCKDNPNPNGLEEAQKFLKTIMQNMKSNLRIIYDGHINNAVILCNA